MRRTAVTILLGFLGGFMLSRMRSLPGGDVLSWTGPEHPLAMRIVILFLAGLALWRVTERVRWIVPASVALGFAVQGFVFGPLPGIPWIALALAALAAPFGEPARRSTDPNDAEAGTHRANLGECAGLFVAGAGVAIGLEAIARHLRLFGAGLAQDDTVFGTAFLALVALGTAAFGRMVDTRAARRLSFPLLLAVACAACFVSLTFIDVIADGRGLRPFLERWGLRAADFGSLRWDLLFGSAAFVAPALVLGAAVAAARGRGSLASAVLGGALGLFAMSVLLSRDLVDLDKAALFSAHLVPLATLLTIGGAALALLSESQRKPRARYIALLFLAPCGIPGLARNTKPVLVLSPWENRMVMPFVAFENAAGLMTVEPSRRNFKIATLNRMLLTPDVDGAAADLQRLRDSLATVPTKENGLRVLFVGQLTPLRAAELLGGGVTHIDRTAAWHRAMSGIETQIFSGEGGANFDRPPGEILSLAGARERIASGAYDLVIAPPFPGDAPGVEPADAPVGTTVVRWIALDEPLAHVVNPVATPLAGSNLEHAVVFSADGLEYPALAFVTNATLAAPESSRHLPLVAFTRDDGADCPWTRVRALWGVRADRARASTFRAVDRVTGSTLSAGLAKFYAAQVPSSPFESPAQRIEFDEETLAEFARATHETSLTPFLRRTWDWIARILIEKRDVTNIDRFIAPLAAAHPEDGTFQIAIAYADLEGLDAAAAVARLEPLSEREPGNARAWYALAESREIAGDAAGAAEAFRRVCELVPDRRVFRRRLAQALCRAGDPEGKRLIAELLAQDPKDEELKVFLEAGPAPEAPKTYTPPEAH